MIKYDPELIVMLTQNDRTVPDASHIFEQCKDSAARFWGMKEDGLPFGQMKELFSYMKRCKKHTVLEVVAYSEKECLDGAKMALECGCEALMGTLFFDSVNHFCQENHLKYMPFVGTVTDRPSVLTGTAEDMIEQARTYLAKGVFGFDLLGYRYVGDAANLIKTFVSRIHAPVCVAGSVNSYARLDELKAISPWAFTIGSAFFENRFGGTFQEQIDKVCAYISTPVREYR